MDPQIEFANNPFFVHDMDKLCAICHKKFDKDTPVSLFAKLPKANPPVTAFEVLETFSQFNIENGPQYLCKTCFNNTAAAHKFRMICNRAHKNIMDYMMHQQNMELKKQLQQESERANLQAKVELQDLQDVDDVLAEAAQGIENPQGLHLLQPKSEPTSSSLLEGPHGSKKGNFGAMRVQCKVCHKLYRQDYLPIHIRVHTGERPYECKICQKAFAQITTLKLHHTSVHSDERSFICNYCGQSFKLVRGLRKHERIHTGEKRYKCSFCEKAFTDSSTLKDHLLVHTKEKHYTCHICAKQFGRRYHLTQHMVSHAAVKRFECHLCGNRFTQRHSLRTHLKMSCHAKKYPETGEVMHEESKDVGETTVTVVKLEPSALYTDSATEHITVGALCSDGATEHIKVGSLYSDGATEHIKVATLCSDDTLCSDSDV